MWLLCRPIELKCLETVLEPIVLTFKHKLFAKRITIWLIELSFMDVVSLDEHTFFVMKRAISIAFDDSIVHDLGAT